MNVIAAPSSTPLSKKSSDASGSLEDQSFPPPPPPLPIGWVARDSKSRYPGYVYYFNQHTGECQWDRPIDLLGSATAAQINEITDSLNAAAAVEAAAVDSSSNANDASGTALVGQANAGTVSVQGGELFVNGNDGFGSETVDDRNMSLNGTSNASSMQMIPANSLQIENSKRKTFSSPNAAQDGSKTASGEITLPRKRPRADLGTEESIATLEESVSSPKLSSSSSREGQVRVLHILKKHSGSRRPASWRNPKITATKEEAISDIKELLAIVREVQQEGAEDARELRATFEELARTESDCSSAKRGGDLGFFGRKKMQPAFENASFGLRIGEVSDVVDTSSGVHIILRLA